MASNLDNGDTGPRQQRWSADELIPFGKYILLSKINSGATAAVYRAKIRGEAGFERLVVVKRILPHMAGDPEFVSTFVREAKTAARLNHTNICPIYELGKVGESLYMAMEWVAGRDLGAITRRLHRMGETMPPVIAAWIAARLCDALDYAHTLKDARGKSAGIIHRDLSPTNIVVSYEGQVKLIDFGLAKAAGRAQQTNVDALKQKLGYMSPELVKGKAPDARSDIFGVGVCLYEMVTARRLFAGKDDMATLKMVSTASVPPPSALVEDAPEELETIIMHALERDPDKRWQTAGDMGQALNTFIAQHGPLGTHQVGEWMLEHFKADRDAEQQRINELLEASHDPKILEERKRFFASPAGAAAAAKAEAARRMSTLPPTAIAMSISPHPSLASSQALARNMPKMPALPRVAVSAGVPDKAPPSAARPARAGNGPAAFEDEPTNFFDANKHAAQETKSTFGEDENTAFFDGQAHAKAVEQALVSQAPTKPPAPGDANVDIELEDDESSPPDADDAFDNPSEKTEFLGGEAFNDVLLEEKPGKPKPAAAAAVVAAPVRQAQPAPRRQSFEEEEATHIFFNKDDGTGIPDLLAEDLDIRAPGRQQPLPASTLNAAPAPQRGAMPLPMSPAAQRAAAQPVASTATPAAVVAAQAAVAAAAPPRDPARNAPTVKLSAEARPRKTSNTGRHRANTLEMAAPRTADRVSSVLMFVGLALLAIAIAGLIAKTSIGVSLGLRKPRNGSIEIRTTPSANAAVKLDGVYRGRAPLRMDGVKTGPRLLELEAEGYLPAARTVDLAGGTTALVDIPLTPRPTAPAAPKAP